MLQYVAYAYDMDLKVLRIQGDWAECVSSTSFFEEGIGAICVIGDRVLDHRLPPNTAVVSDDENMIYQIGDVTYKGYLSDDELVQYLVRI